mmetsp:Transcript_15986/g.45537  ORF Transcript_15986/g.45537 Transcript_15986/m.45537 type:complete len:114 (+) Transcript_15986:821-1162(+)
MECSGEAASIAASLRDEVSSLATGVDTHSLAGCMSVWRQTSVYRTCAWVCVVDGWMDAARHRAQTDRLACLIDCTLADLDGDDRQTCARTAPSHDGPHITRTTTGGERAMQCN